MRIRLPARVAKVLRWLNGEQLRSRKIPTPSQDLPIKEPEDLAAAEGKGMGPT